MIQFLLYLGKLLLASQGASSSVLLDADRNAKHVVCPVIVNLNALNYLWHWKAEPMCHLSEG